jgi:lysine 2,3-aminomutase
MDIGIRQFIIQTHFESPMEITPESKKAVKMLLNSGWMVANQLVFTTPASRRGHTAKLKKNSERYWDTYLLYIYSKGFQGK